MLTDARWKTIVHLFPAEVSTGRPPLDHRCVLTGILWVNRTGAGWNHLPTGYGPGTTVQRRYRRWREDGTWDKILAILLEPHDPSST